MPVARSLHCPQLLTLAAGTAQAHPAGATLKDDIDRGLTPGGVIAIARRGKLVALEAYGWRDKRPACR